MVMPMFELPWPDGPYPIATIERRFHWSTANFERSVTVRLWYPASISPIGSGILSGWLRSVASVGAKAADDRFPLLLGFAGWNGSLHGNVVLSHALASHGFVVAAVGYPTGRDVPSRAIPMDFSSAEAFAATLELADRKARLQADTASFVLDMLARLDGTDRITCVVDRTGDACVGVFGFSFGGAVAAQVAWQDTRVRAVMNLDGWLFGDAAMRHFSQPFLVVSDDTPLPDEAKIRAEDVTRRNRARLTARDARWQDAQLAHGGGYKLTILGSSHSDFCDRSLLNPLNIIALQHTWRARRTMRIVQAYALGFFGRLLDGRPAALLDASGNMAPYPEARFQEFVRPVWPSDSCHRATSVETAIQYDVSWGRQHDGTTLSRAVQP
jgi:dienelactone hydrolase